MDASGRVVLHVLRVPLLNTITHCVVIVCHISPFDLMLEDIYVYICIYFGTDDRLVPLFRHVM